MDNTNRTLLTLAMWVALKNTI